VGRGAVLAAFARGPGELQSIALAARETARSTAGLLKYIETPGVEIRSLLTRATKDVFDETKGTQRPWQNLSLHGDFYFLPAAAILEQTTVPSPKLENSPQVPQEAGPISPPPIASLRDRGE
jgi:uncharacterized caspase-like protein